ncbi:uncharacterized protein [Littorina saxatilis]|uniref:Spaetzle domain-containing protein n=1 Tax=Littorina saxatilis TaxID=31220 RepID=A0AAN9G6V9_9CAEN
MAIMQASVLVSAFLVLLVPDFILAQSDIRFANPPPMDYGEKSDIEMMLDAGLNTTVMTQEDALALVCNGLQDDVNGCRSVMPFDEYARINCERLFGIPAPPLSRKKRHSSWSSNYWNRFWNRPTNNFNNNNNNNFGRSVLVCPSAIDQSFAYQLNPDSALYPATVIGPELVQSPLFNVITNAIVLPEDPPQVLVQPFQLRSNATCPFTQLRLYGYQSLRFVSQCWVLQNFGDLIFYRQCDGDRRCRGCQSQSSRFNRNPSSQKLCMPEYRVVNFWAYCPSLPFGNRFVRDKIIVPMACTCQDVPCDRVFQG